ncbi:MAG TPA: hypothetical protein VJT15_02845 [Pyrinomonadaceae bacterium]|nr:hypothetical protein [Pyrinomonadaceae bacterium]
MIRKVLSSKKRPVREARADYEVVCSWCGALIRSNAAASEEQMCLICHARMLNDYFQRLRKVSDERRTSRRF